MPAHLRTATGRNNSGVLVMVLVHFHHLVLLVMLAVRIHAIAVVVVVVVDYLVHNHYYFVADYIVDHVADVVGVGVGVHLVSPDYRLRLAMHVVGVILEHSRPRTCPKMPKT